MIDLKTYGKTDWRDFYKLELLTTRSEMWVKSLFTILKKTFTGEMMKNQEQM